jgi:hypothetical protein
MVRPGFGKGDGSVITALESPPNNPQLYPNPSRGTCTLKSRAEAVDVYDLTGRRAGFQWETVGEETIITFAPESTGLFLVRLLVNGRVHTQKIMVLAGGR